MAAPDGRVAGPAPRIRRPRPGLRTGDLCREARRRGLRPVGSTCRSACWPPPRDAPLVQGDALRLPVRTARSTASPAASPCATSSTWSRSSPSCASSASGGRIALLEVAEPANRLLGPRHLLREGRALVIGGLLSDASPTATCPGRWPTCLAGGDGRADHRGAGFTAVERRCCPEASPSSSPDEAVVTGPATSALIACTRRLDHDVDLLAFAGDDGVLIEKGAPAQREALAADWPARDPTWPPATTLASGSASTSRGARDRRRGVRGPPLRAGAPPPGRARGDRRAWR